MMAFPEPPAFYPLIRMPKVFSPIPGNVCPTPRSVFPPSPPPFPNQHMPRPFGMAPMPFPPPNRLNTPPSPPFGGPPSPFSSSPEMSMPPKFLPPPPPNMQRPLTPPPSAGSDPCSPRPPVLDLNHQNEILTQRWQWLPSMLCSLVDDPSGAVYKIISINWDGRSKECYLQKHAEEGESDPEDDKDVPESDLVPPRPREVPCELTPPASEGGWSPACSNLGPNYGPPVREDNYHEDSYNEDHYNGGSGPEDYDDDREEMPSHFSSPRSAYVEDDQDDDDYDEDYESKPSLSLAMAERGMFPADEDYFARNQSYSGESEYRSEDEYLGPHDDDYAQAPQGFQPIRQQESQGFVNLRAPESQEFVSIRRHDSCDRRYETPLSKSERSERSGRSERTERSERSERSEKRSHSGSHGKKKRSHREKGEKGEKEKDGEKSKSKSKSRSRRSSTSSKRDERRDDRKEEKKESSHRSGRSTRKKPSIWTLPKF